MIFCCRERRRTWWRKKRKEAWEMNRIINSPPTPLPPFLSPPPLTPLQSFHTHIFICRNWFFLICIFNSKFCQTLFSLPPHKKSFNISQNCEKLFYFFFFFCFLIFFFLFCSWSAGCIISPSASFFLCFCRGVSHPPPPLLPQPNISYANLMNATSISAITSTW